jgi:uncharacterized SAM-binding protein YcdF (DUF218 family)
MHTSDIALILGIRFDKNWQLRDDLKNILDEAYRCYQEGTIKKIIVSGKWTIWYDWSGITPPITEAALMKQYLVTKGVRSQDIIREEKSKDTIGCLYYSLLKIRKDLTIQHVTIISSTQRLKRIRFLTQKIFGNEYRVSFLHIDESNFNDNALGNEQAVHAEQESLLAHIEEGNHRMLRHRLYNSRYYTDQKRAVQSNTRKNELE